MSNLFGRTNRTFARVWLSLQANEGPAEGWAPQLADAAADSGAVLDISNQPGYWGELLRGRDVPLLAFGGTECENAVSADHATDLLSAHIFQTLSSLGRIGLDFYFLRVRRGWEEFQVDGAFRALETAREDGLIRHFGLWAEGHPLAVLGWWQFRDAFEAVMIPHHPRAEDYAETLAPLARERRVGLVGCQSLSWGTGCAVTELPGVQTAGIEAGDLISHALSDMTTMVGVRSEREVLQAVAAVPRRNDEAMQLVREAVEDRGQWAALREDRRPWVRTAAERMMRD